MARVTIKQIPWESTRFTVSLANGMTTVRGALPGSEVYLVKIGAESKGSDKMNRSTIVHIQANQHVTACGRGVERPNPNNELTLAADAAPTCKACISAHKKALVTGRYGRLGIALAS